jgi:Ser/Thr protein kinase RdoA (MazF antagonist)
VAGRFGLQPLRVSRIDRGHINESYFVDTPEGSYVLQRINRSVFGDPDGMMSNVLVVHRFVGGGLVPVPVAAPDGRWLVADGPDLWRALERVPDARPLEAVPTGVLGQAAELLGRFHARLVELDPRELLVTLPNFHDLRHRLGQLREVIAEDPRGRVASSGQEIEAALAGAGLVSVTESIEAVTPIRVVHNDAKLDNILFRGEDAAAIVDLDTLMPGRWFWDVGDLVRSGAATAGEDETRLDRVTVDPWRYQALVEGYRRTVSGVATDAEIEAVDAAGAIVTYEQALRFLTDWLAGDVYYRTSGPQQNLDRARTQLRLLSNMPHSPL